jgi:hypothetical protein
VLDGCCGVLFFLLLLFVVLVMLFYGANLPFYTSRAGVQGLRW